MRENENKINKMLHFRLNNLETNNVTMKVRHTAYIEF